MASKLYSLPKRFHQGFRLPEVKPTGPVEVDLSTLGGRLEHGWIFQNNPTRDVLGRKNGTIVGTSIFRNGQALEFSGNNNNHRIALRRSAHVGRPDRDFLNVLLLVGIQQRPGLSGHVFSLQIKKCRQMQGVAGG